MNVYVSTACGAGIYQEILNLDAIDQKRKPDLGDTTNRNIVFRISKYNTQKEYCEDDGSGNEASWWSAYIGTAKNVLAFIRKDKGTFPAHDERILLPVLEDEKDVLSDPACWLYCIPKPRVRFSGRFCGPDKQNWTDDETMSKLFRHLLSLPADMRIVFADNIRLAK